MERFIGAVAVVTGCSAGIGAAICKKLVKHGVIVVGLARRLDKLEKLSEELSNTGEKNIAKFHPIRCDVTVEADIKNAFQWITSKLGPISILINNAGVFEMSSLSDVTSESITRTFDTNVKAAILCSQLAMKNMTDNDIQGHIININGLAGHHIVHLEPNEIMIYTTSKHALKLISEGLRRELVQKNSDIKVTNLSPGLVNTDMANDFINNSPGSMNTTKNGDSLSAKEVLQPEDIADACIAVLNTPSNILNLLFYLFIKKFDDNEDNSDKSEEKKSQNFK